MTTNNDENETSTYLASSEQDIQSINFVNNTDQTITNSIIDITNQSIKHGTISTDNHDEHHVTTVDVKSTNTSVSVQKRNFSCVVFFLFRNIILSEANECLGKIFAYLLYYILSS